MVSLVAIPAGVATRLDRRIEASIAPMPQSVPVEIQTGAGTVDAPAIDAPTIDAPKVDAVSAATVETTSEAVEAASEAVQTIEPVGPASAQAALEDPEDAPEISEPAAVAVLSPELAAPLPPPDVVSSQAGEVPTVAPEVYPETVEAISPAPSRPTPTTRPSPAAPKPAEPPGPNPSKAMPFKKKPAAAKPARKMPAKRDVEEARARQRPAFRKPARPASAGAAGAPSDIGASTTARTAGATRTDYAALVLAAIRSRVRYPAEARARGREGVAMVSFAVGSSGRVGAATLARGTGDASLDGAAVSLVRALSLPPPPGGSFRATVPIRYRLAF
jgi:protein TonB